MMYFKPEELIRQPDFIEFGRFFDISFFSFLQFFRVLEDCDRFLKTLILCDKAIEMNFSQLNLDRNYSVGKKSEKDFFWSHVLTLGIMFCNRHNKPFEGEDKESETFNKNKRELNLSDSFRNRNWEQKKSRKENSKKMFCTKSSWNDLELLKTLEECGVDVFPCDQETAKDMGMSDIEDFFTNVLECDQSVGVEWSFLDV